VANNRYGIRLYSSSNNSVYGNNVANNRYGIRLDSSSNNVFYHNFVSNSRQAYNEESANVWDLGYPFGGNYWSDFSGVDLHSGPYQNGTGYDWIGDTAYVIDANNADRYPLTHPFDPQTDDAKIAYRNLLTEYNGLRSDFEKMNSTYYGLLADYATLSHNVDQLAEDLDALNSSYYQHLQDYSGLQANHTSLQNNYNNLLTAFAALNSSYTSLKADYNALNTSYNSLNTSLTDYQQTTQNELTNVKNMLYAFVAVTVILAAAIVYMATRKPKTKPET
jgi:parallel beta-helix repeat protein